MNIVITDKAAKEVKCMLEELEDKSFLRLRVVGGSCAGFSIKLDLDDDINDKLDEVYDINGINVVVDSRSAMYLDGVTVDFHDDLNKRGFSVVNPSVKSKCGCGSSSL